MELTSHTRRTSSGMTSSTKVTVPFYAPPLSGRKTSAEIISEARAAILKASGDKEIIGALRPIDTKRPFTPRERQRTLFGTVKNSGSFANKRPSSSFSLEYLQFQDLEPESPPKVRLNPIPYSPVKASLNDSIHINDHVQRLKLPSIARRKQFRSTISLENLPDVLEVEEGEIQEEKNTNRKAYSSPVQRSKPIIVSPTPGKRSLSNDQKENENVKTESHVKAVQSAWEDISVKKKQRITEILDKKQIPVDQPNALLKKIEGEYKAIVQKEDCMNHPNRAVDLFGEKTKDCKEDVAKSLVDVNKETVNVDVIKSSPGKQDYQWIPQNYIPSKPFPQDCEPKVKDILIEDPILRPIYQALQESLAQSLNTVSSIVEQLTLLAKRDENDTEVIMTLSKLFKALEREHLFGTTPHNGKTKNQVLKVLYKFIERSNESLLLQIAKTILAMRVTGNNLSGVCKLVFKIARNDKNDKLFLEDGVLGLILEALGSASPLEDAEACVYGYGALKFLTMNSDILREVLNLGALELMVLHIKMIASARNEGLKIPEQTSHALFQLTGALRNVAGEDIVFPQFVSTGAITAVCHIMQLFSSDLDVISNASRTLSIISTYDDCCKAIFEFEDCIQLFVKLLQKYPGRQDIIVRLAYVLGNIMAKSDNARLMIYSHKEAVATLLNLLELYLEKDLHMGSRNTFTQIESQGSTGSIQDVCVKIIRILANISINPSVGMSLSVAESLDNDIRSEESRRFLDILLVVLERKSDANLVKIVDGDELLHSVLCTLNNLSYYQISGFGQKEEAIANALVLVLSKNNRECIIEAMRVFGNLTRSEISRNIIIEKLGLQHLFDLLSSEDHELVCATAGVLINMMSDWDKRIALKESGGISRLIRILQRSGETDWQLSTLICQALWNFCTDSNNMHACLGPSETNELLSMLAEFLDEERLFGVDENLDSKLTTTLYQQWEEFAGVATNLLEKIDMFLDTLEPPSLQDEMKYEILDAEPTT